jgi:hypothetical protein
MGKSLIITGARVVCYINGQKFGRVSSFRWDSATPRKAIYGLDSSEPYELAPLPSRITGSLTVYRTVGDGGLEGSGIVAQFADIPREKYFSLTLIERSSDTVVFRADDCAVTNQSWDVPSKGVMMGNFSFEALSWSNEAKR